MKFLITFIIVTQWFVSESFATTNGSVASNAIDMIHIGLLQIPAEILRHHGNFTDLHLSSNKIKYIAKDDFPKESVKELRYINLRNNFIQRLHEDAFANMPHLLEIDLSHNMLEEVPIIKAPKLRIILLGNNKIRKISYEAMKHYPSLEHLALQENLITVIERDTFAENKKLIYMDMSDNPIKRIDERGLVGPKELMFLHLHNTPLSNFPSEGIASLETLNLRNTPNLFKIPHPSKFRKLKKVHVTYNMFCCAFRAESIRGKTNDSIPCSQIEKVEKSTAAPTTAANTASMRLNHNANETSHEEDDFGFGEGLWEDEDAGFWDEFLADVVDGLEEEDSNYSLCAGKGKSVGFDSVIRIQCDPKPDAFNPCEDVMGTNLLRSFSWIIATFAIIGNLFQLVILFNSKQKSVYKLLMYNLGFSNLLMGIYLLVLCCVDAYTYGEYYNYVQSWQYNGGCQAFGFIAVFATSLSVCSLVLITTERFLLIIFALQAGNQMHIKHAKYCVAGAWFYSFIVAILPATNIISSYSKTAICLPMDVYTTVSEGYVVWLLIAYILAFFSILFCYVRMYRNIKDVRPSVSTSQTIDKKVAKRMALIIFSNFLCWLPISIAGLTALYSGTSFNVGVAKFLIVFIFPLNACTNPFLYAIFTKVFRDDTIALFYSLGFGFCRSNKEEQTRPRAPSYFKSRSKKRGNTGNGRHFLHIQPPEEGCTYINERNIEAQTDFASPETPIKVLIDPHERKTGRIEKLHDDSDSPSYNRKHFDELSGKERSDSTRGLLEEYRRRGDIPCSESTETSSTGMSLRSAIEVDNNFANMIGSVNKAEGSILDI